jgi:hypothetical protein
MNPRYPFGLLAALLCAVPAWGLDFCAGIALTKLQLIYDSGRVHLNSFDCATSDFNGGRADGGALQGNGIPDGAEFALVEWLFTHPEIDLSAGNLPGQIDAGVSASEAVRVVDNNAQRFSEFGVAYIDTPPPLLEVDPERESHFYWMSAYATIGGRDGVETYNQMFFAIQRDPEWRNELGLYDLSLVPYLSAEGDADGDGMTNRDEYAMSGAAGFGAYVAAALDPSRNWETAAIRVQGPAFSEIGDGLDLRASLPAGVTVTSYVWSHNGIAMSGETGANLFRPNLTLADAGVYQVTITLAGAKTQVVSEPFVVNVVPEVPAAGMAGRVGLALALCMLAGVALRRPLRG